jgi:lactate dehydrogenase-like 2-hydroxyacid dehydrogenase
MEMVFLDALSMGEDADFSRINALGTCEYFETTSEALTLERIKGKEVVITNKVLITETMMRATPSLKLICVAATGMNNIDLEAAKTLNIEVKNVAGYSTNSVVQLTFSILFYLINKSRYYDDYVKGKYWQTSDLFTHVGRPFHELAGKTWGIIGMGAIGQEVGKIAAAFGCQIIYYSTSGKNAAQPFLNVELDELIRESDIISIHAPLNADTENLLNYENMKQLKDEATVLNLGRGGIINEEDLANTIKDKNIYVGTDVITTEPILANNPLLDVQSERLYITPHIAWTSVEARERLIASIAENIKTSN